MKQCEDRLLNSVSDEVRIAVVVDESLFQLSINKRTSYYSLVEFIVTIRPARAETHWLQTLTPLTWIFLLF